MTFLESKHGRNALLQLKQKTLPWIADRFALSVIKKSFLPYLFMTIVALAITDWGMVTAILFAAAGLTIVLALVW